MFNVIHAYKSGEQPWFIRNKHYTCNKLNILEIMPLIRSVKNSVELLYFYLACMYGCRIAMKNM